MPAYRPVPRHPFPWGYVPVAERHPALHAAAERSRARRAAITVANAAYDAATAARAHDERADANLGEHRAATEARTAGARALLGLVEPECACGEAD